MEVEPGFLSVLSAEKHPFYFHREIPPDLHTDISGRSYSSSLSLICSSQWEHSQTAELRDAPDSTIRAKHEENTKAASVHGVI